MRISDWSSDVCSSDLFGDSYEHLRRRGVTIAPAVEAANGAVVTFADGTQASPRSVILATGYDPGDRWLPQPNGSARPRRTMTDIGRASGRERVSPSL